MSISKYMSKYIFFLSLDGQIQTIQAYAFLIHSPPTSFYKQVVGLPGRSSFYEYATFLMNLYSQNTLPQPKSTCHRTIIFFWVKTVKYLLTIKYIGMKINVKLVSSVGFYNVCSQSRENTSNGFETFLCINQVILICSYTYLQLYLFVVIVIC